MDISSISASELDISQAELDRYKAMAEASGTRLDLLLLEAGCLTEERFLQMASEEYGMEYVPSLATALAKEEPLWKSNPEQICAFPLQWLRKHLAVPIEDDKGRLVLAMSRPSSWLVAQEMHIHLGKKPSRPILTESASIQHIINTSFDQNADSNDSAAGILDSQEQDAFGFDEGAVNDILDNTSEAPFIRFVNMVLAQAVRMGASDIHIEPYRDQSRVRFRLDGMLYERHVIDKNHHAAIVSRVKVMARLNIAEKRLPQDGRIAVTLGGREVGLRVSSLPTSFGERIVIRLLEKSERVLSLSELGLSNDGLDLMRDLAKSTHGIVLVTGPTGSGKTTTLYAVLQDIASPDQNILTIEDPVEYELDGVGQMQVNSKIGLNFADGLRSIVRQDPDVILIGEIRDTETAAIAVQSALTGHLVFSTLHTNDAPGAVARLLDMEIEPFLLASVLRGVIAQRLVRILCPDCKEAYMPLSAELDELAPAIDAWKNTPLYRPKGCSKCMDTGYKGRRAIYEIMPVYEPLKRPIADRADANILRNIALEAGMKDLRHDGLLKAIQGQTSLAEVSRVTHG